MFLAPGRCLGCGRGRRAAAQVSVDKGKLLGGNWKHRQAGLGKERETCERPGSVCAQLGEGQHARVRLQEGHINHIPRRSFALAPCVVIFALGVTKNAGRYGSSGHV